MIVHPSGGIGALIFDDLREIQSQYGYLPPEQLQALSQRTKTPLYRIHGVADFYPHFHLSRPPKVTHERLLATCPAICAAPTI